MDLNKQYYQINYLKIIIDIIFIIDIIINIYSILYNIFLIEAI